MHRPRSPFWLCLWLTVALIATKAVHFGLPPEWTFSEVRSRIFEIVNVSGNDCFFALGVALAGKGLLLLTRRQARIQRMVWVGFVVFCALSVLYSVVSVRMFEILRMPLTYPLLSVGGDLTGMQSSVSAFVTTGIVVALVGAPALYLVVVTLSDRFLRFGPGRLARTVHVSCVALGLVWFADARRRQTASDWGGTRDETCIAQNPHYTMLSSFLREVFGSKSVTLKEAFPAEYLGDFQTGKEQPGAGQPTPGLARGPRNVIVVVCESVGTQHLSLYGSAFKTWPRMGAEAAHALVFDHYYSHITNTANSLYSLTLSAYPPLTWRQQTESQPDAKGTTAAEVLKKQGYRTAFLTGGFNDWACMDRFLKDRGYDVVRDGRDAVKEGEPEVSSWGVEDRWLVDDIFRFIDRKPPQAEPSQPFYVFSWTQATHHPYEPRPTWKDTDFLKGDKSFGEMTWDLGRYLNSLYELDLQLGRLMEGLRARNLADDTIVVITGDHGEAFGVPHANSVGHTGKVFQEDVNVPLIIWSPALFKEGGKSHAFGAHVDLSATVLDLLGIAAPESWQGRSILNPAHPPRCYFYGAIHNYLLGVRENQFKYVFNATLGQHVLYDLSTDPQERANVARQHPEVCLNLRRRLAAWVEYQARQ